MAQPGNVPISVLQPHYVRLQVESQVVVCCGWCGSVVPPMMQDMHNAWHSQIIQALAA